MLISFHSKAASSITMFADDAYLLLKMMGLSNTVPSALLAGDIPAALSRLQQGLAAAESAGKTTPENAPEDDGSEKQAPVKIWVRAYPLVQMLTAAAAQGTDVMWEAGAPVI